MKSRRITAVLLVFSLCLCLAVFAQAASHKHNWIERSRTEATCTQEGRIVYVCSCGEKRTETIPALGHLWSDWADAVAATCTAPGTQAKSCARCSAEKTRETEALGHVWSEPAYEWAADYSAVTME